MIYSDENIITMIAEAKKERALQCGTEVTVDKAKYNFVLREPVAALFSMVMPESFTFLPPKAAEEKYPSVNRPQLIYSNSDSTINFTFSYTEYSIKPDEIKDCIKGFQVVIKRMYPANTFYGLMYEHLGESMLGYFDYSSYALDDNLYNIMFVTGICDRLLLGTFSCLLEFKDNWKPLALQMIRSITEIKEAAKQK